MMNDLVQQMMNEDNGEQGFVKDLNIHKGLVTKFINSICTALQARSKDHDKSKLGDPELPIFAKHYEEFKKTTFGTPEYEELLKKVQPALDHHYTTNRHHPEKFENGVEGMNLIDLVEMICDWKAASMRQDSSGSNDMKKSIEHNQERFGFSDEMKQILLNTVELLG